VDISLLRLVDSIFPFIVQCNVRWVKKKMGDNAEALRKEEAKLEKWEAEVETLRNKITSISDDIRSQAGDEKFRQELKGEREELKSQQQKLEVQIAKSELKIAEWKEKGEEEIAKLQDILDALRKPAVGAVLLEVKLKPFVRQRKGEKYHAVIDFVETSAYFAGVKSLTKILAITPTITEHRDLRVECFVGAMGHGKTTNAIEAACRVAVDRERARLAEDGQDMNAYSDDELMLSTKTCVVSSNLAYFAQVLGDPSSKGPVECLARAIAFGNNYKISESELALVNLDMIEKRLQEDGFCEVILHLDEVQSNRGLAKAIVEGCFILMVNMSTKIMVVPILSGISRPFSRTTPSHPICHEQTVTILRGKELFEFEKNFCKAIGVDSNVYANSTYLRRLFRLCEGHPNMVVKVCQAILSQKKNAGTGYEFCESLAKNLSAHLASTVFERAVDDLANVYGPARWHGVIRSSRISDDINVVDRDSWKSKTSRVIEWIMLDALLGSKVAKSDSKVGTTFENDDEFPTYDTCVEAGLIDLVNGVVELPLMALLVMNKFVTLIPPSIQDPFLTDWETLEFIAAFTVYLRLRRFALQGEAVIRLSELRPGAQSSGFDDLYVSVPLKNALRFYMLGGSITGKSGDVIQEGAPGRGSIVTFEPSMIAITKRGEAGIDALMILNVGTHPEKLNKLLLFGNQDKHGERG